VDRAAAGLAVDHDEHARGIERQTLAERIVGDSTAVARQRAAGFLADDRLGDVHAGAGMSGRLEEAGPAAVAAEYRALLESRA